MLPCECRREGPGLGVEDEVHAALPIEDHVLGLMLRDCGEAHDLEQTVELARVGVAKFDELETVGSHRVGV
jgi:hypothetical protein